MAQDLIRQWKERVSEVQGEIDQVTSEIKSVEKQKKILLVSSAEFVEQCRKEKTEMMSQLKGFEVRASAADKRTKQANQMKADADAATQSAKQTYEDLARTVRVCQQQEKELETREDYPSLLQRESAAWHTEEEELRRRIGELEERIKAQRKAQKQTIVALSDELREVEQEAHTARMARKAEDIDRPYQFDPAVALRHPQMFNITSAAQRSGGSATSAPLPPSQLQSRTGSVAPSSNNGGATTFPKSSIQQAPQRNVLGDTTEFYPLRSEMVGGGDKAKSVSRKRDVLGDLTNYGSQQ